MDHSVPTYSLPDQPRLVTMLSFLRLSFVPSRRLYPLSLSFHSKQNLFCTNIFNVMNGKTQIQGPSNHISPHNWLGNCTVWSNLCILPSNILLKIFFKNLNFSFYTSDSNDKNTLPPPFLHVYHSCNTLEKRGNKMKTGHRWNYSRKI